MCVGQDDKENIRTPVSYSFHLNSSHLFILKPCLLAGVYPTMALLIRKEGQVQISFPFDLVCIKSV